MRKVFSKYLLLLIIPLGIILGKLRQIQIQNYETSIGKQTMKGIFAFMGYSAFGIFGGIALFFIALIHSNKILTRKEKDVAILIIILISVPLAFIALFFGL